VKQHGLQRAASASPYKAHRGRPFGRNKNTIPLQSPIGATFLSFQKGITVGNVELNYLGLAENFSQRFYEGSWWVGIVQKLNK
jgi:hypothetical protein